MKHFLRAASILFIALIGGLASFLVFYVVQDIVDHGNSNFTDEDRKWLFICVLMAVSAVLGIVFQIKILTHPGRRYESFSANIIDQGHQKAQNTALRFMRKLHWTLWTGNFAFAVGNIIYSVFALGNHLENFPLEELPIGWEQYAIFSTTLIVGVTLLMDELILLKNFARSK